MRGSCMSLRVVDRGSPGPAGGEEEVGPVCDVALLVGVDTAVALGEARQEVALAEEVEREVRGRDAESALDDHVVDGHEVHLRSPVARLPAESLVRVDERLVE